MRSDSEVLTIKTPAKINLNLKILGRREDGFHELETLMVPVGLADTLNFRQADSGIKITCNDPSLPTGDDNLIHRAATAFFAHTGIAAGVEVHVDKSIPAGAGLGGGSSDAAATLLALDSLFDTSLPHRELFQLAAANGSDTAWFLTPKAAICRGRGELIEPLQGIPSFPGLLIKPPFGISTAWAYRAYAEDPGRPEETLTLENICIANDLERPVFSKHAYLAALKKWLNEQPEVRAAGMSGSGSTLFAALNGGQPSFLIERLQSTFGTTNWIQETEINPDKV